MVSAALGMVRAKKLLGEEGDVVAVIGDGALTGGLAYEALDDAGDSKLPLVVVLNDNEMSISRNVGAMSRNLAHLRASKGYNRFKRFVVRVLDVSYVGKRFSKSLESFKNRIKRFVLQNTFFEELGFTYLGPIDGHDIPKMEKLLIEARALQKPVLVHVVTQKGKGYLFSEENPEKFHGVAPFSVSTGEVKKDGGVCCSETFGRALTALAEKDQRIVAITAAMQAGTGLKGFAKRFPERFFDVGIAEGHALTMAAGMACCGLKPVAAIYSSFLQRGVDMVLHDICLQKLPVVLSVDRAGLVGEDGETHQGLYDPAFLCAMPHMSLYAPATLKDISEMLAMAIERNEPAAIRYNRGALPPGEEETEPLQYGKWRVLLPVQPVTVIAAGVLVQEAREAAKNCGCGLIEATFYKPLDYALLDELRAQGASLLVAEENVAALGLYVSAYCPELKVKTFCVPDRIVPQASVERQRVLCGIDEKAMEEALKSLGES